MTHVPYKGASLAVADLIAGHVPVTSTTLTTAATQIKAGRARALAVSSAKRVPEFPEVPTFAEMGYPELTASIWFSLSGPAGVAPEIVSRLNAEVRRALQAPTCASGCVPRASNRAISTRGNSRRSWPRS